MTTTTVKAGYKMTEIGVIPEDWEVNLIEQFGSVIDGDRGHNYPSSDDFRADGYCLFLSATNVTKTGFRFDECQFISKEKDESLSKGKLKRCDVVLTTRGTVGNIAFYRDSIPYNHMRINSGMVLIRAENKSRITQDFLYELCKSNILANQIDRLSFGSAQPQLTVKGILSFQFPLPSTLAEQQAIATVLSDTDELIGSLDGLIAKKRRIKEGAMQELLTGKKRLAGFTGEWEVKKLGEFLNYEQPTAYLVTGTEYNNNNQTPVLTAGKTFILGYTNEEHGIFYKLPVIIFDDFTTAIQFVDFPFKAKSSAMKMLIPRNDKVNMRFIYEIMLRIKYPLGDHKRHWIAEYQHLEITVPPTLAEQQAIAQILSDMDTEITALQQKREKYKLVKQGLMQVLLTGKIRLI